MLGPQRSSGQARPLEAPEGATPGGCVAFGSQGVLVSKKTSNDVLVENALSWLLDDEGPRFLEDILNFATELGLGLEIKYD